MTSNDPMEVIRNSQIARNAIEHCTMLSRMRKKLSIVSKIVLQCSEQNCVYV